MAAFAATRLLFIASQSWHETWPVVSQSFCTPWSMDICCCFLHLLSLLGASSRYQLLLSAFLQSTQDALDDLSELICAASVCLQSIVDLLVVVVVVAAVRDGQQPCRSCCACFVQFCAFLCIPPFCCHPASLCALELFVQTLVDAAVAV